MIKTLLRIAWLNLKRDYVALGLSFVLPIVFFSIFALIFGGVQYGDNTGQNQLKVLAVDLDHGKISRRLLDALGKQSSLKLEHIEDVDAALPTAPEEIRQSAVNLVRRGKYSVAVVIPAGWSDRFMEFSADDKPVEVVYDAANPLGQYSVSGLIQAAAFTSVPDVFMDRGMGWMDTIGAGLTPQQRAILDDLKQKIQPGGIWDNSASKQSPENSSPVDQTQKSASRYAGIVQIVTSPARPLKSEGLAPGASSIISYYAAGIGVMFLLFSMAAAGGSLLEEEEGGTLERLLNSQVSMGRILASKWFFHCIVGVVQLTIMFVWGALAFGLDLWSMKHLSGYVLMTVPTAAAAAAFGIVLATLSRSRAQLNGLSTTLILVMSALGGSMAPRFIMPKYIDTLSLFTFNGWALDGYLKVFWYEDPNASLGVFLVNLLPQVGVITGLIIVFMVIARLLAWRWETI
jgi:ABC-2 type transport system permease protein